jgi:hypothetical protein
MRSIVIALHNQAVEIRYPEDLQSQIDLFFGSHASAIVRPQLVLSIESRGPNRYSMSGEGVDSDADLTTAELADLLLETTITALVEKLDSAVALHAAAIGWGNNAVVIAGPSGAGKSSIAGALVNAGFEFLSDELTLLQRGGTILGFRRPLLARANSNDLVGALTWPSERLAVRTQSNILIHCSNGDESPASRTPTLIVFPHYAAGANLEMARVSPAMASLKLMECNLNARNFADHGLRELTEFARSVPAISLTYGRYKQLDRFVDFLTKFSVRPSQLEQIVARVADQAVEVVEWPSHPTEDMETPKLTIGMATYDDFDGVYFTLQAMRAYHPEILDEVEFLIIDNNPTGPAAEGLKNLENWIPNLRYIPHTAISGTAIRDYVFKEARGEFVLCVDCHVLVVPGALRRLLDYFERNPDTDDLLQGPLVYDDLQSYSTHLDPVWRQGMYGCWVSDPAGADPDQQPFEIPMQGLGLFACRRAAWPGFNPAFRGFGGEEGYIHEKFRQRGGKAICLPFLRWLHRFYRPRGVPYVNVWEDRVWNYHIGFRELGWDTGEIVEHFKAHLGETGWRQVVDKLGAEFVGIDAVENPVAEKPVIAPAEEQPKLAPSKQVVRLH